MLRIFKYEFPIQDYFHLILPRNSKFLSAQVQNEKPVMWFVVDTETDISFMYRFSLKCTGDKLDLDQKDYLATLQLGDIVGHLFYEGIKK